MFTTKFAEDGWHKCGNCEKIWHASALQDIEDLEQRVEVGGTVPSGECPDMTDCCGALCYPCKPNKVKDRKKLGMGMGFCPEHGEYRMDSEETECPLC